LYGNFIYNNVTGVGVRSDKAASIYPESALRITN